MLSSTGCHHYFPSVETSFALLTFPDSFQTPDRDLACLSLPSSPSAAPQKMTSHSTPALESADVVHMAFLCAYGCLS